MKIAILADLHLRGKDYLVRLPFLVRALQEMKARGISWVLHCGDLFNHWAIRDRDVSAHVLASAMADALTQGGLPWVSIRGNHDWPGPGHVAATEVLRHHPLFFDLWPWMATARLGPDVEVIGLPWLPYLPEESGRMLGGEVATARVLEALRRMRNRPRVACRIVLGHISVLGAVMQESQRELVVERGGYDPRPAPSDLWNALAEGQATHCFLGHIHKRQGLLVNHAPLQYLGYIGSFWRTRFDEANNPDGWWLLDTDTGAVEPIPLHGPDYVTVTSFQDLERVRGSLGPCDMLRLKAAPGAWDVDTSATVVWDPPVDSLPVQTSLREGIPELSGDDPLPSLLKAWAEVKKISVPEGKAWEEKLFELNEAGDPSRWVSETTENGSLEKLLILKVSGVGRLVDQRVEFPDQGWTAITGPNGAGKSTLLDCILFALWGGDGTEHSLRPMSEAGAVIDLTFQACGGRVFRVVRRFDKQNTAELTGDGLSHPLGPNQSLVNKWALANLGSRDEFLRTCFLSQHGDKDIISDGDANRMAFLRRALDLGRIDRVRDHAAKKMSELAASPRLLNEKLEEVKMFHARAEVVRAELVGQKELEQEATREVEEARALWKARAEIGNRLALYKEKKAREKQLQDSVAGLEFELERARANVVKVEARVAAWKEVEKVRARSQELEGWYVQRSGQISKLRTLEPIVSVLENVGCKDNLLACPLIEEARQAETQIAVIQKSLAEDGPPDKRYTELTQVREQLKTLTATALPPSQLEEAIRQRDGAYDRLTKVFQDLGKLREELKELAPSIDPEVDWSEVQANLQVLERNWKEATRRTVQLESEIEHLIAANKAAEKALQKYEREVEDLREWQFLEQAFCRTGVPQLLIANALPSLQKELNRIAGALPGFRLELDTVKTKGKGELAEAMSIRIYLPDGTGGWDARKASGGERMLARLLMRAGLLSWGKGPGSGWKVLLLDEPTAALDSGRTEAAVGMLRRLGDRFEQVLVATHDEVLAEQVERRVSLG